MIYNNQHGGRNLMVEKIKKLKVEVFAFNLQTPTHMEWTKDGRLLVSEHTLGQVKDITSGGDFKEKKPFAHGLKGPSSILPLENGRILVAEAWGNRITDITEGGYAHDKHSFVNLNEPYSLSTINGHIFVTEQTGLSSIGLSEIIPMANGSHQEFSLVSDIPAIPLPGLEGLSPYKEMQNIIESPKCGSWTVAVPFSSFDGKASLFVACSALGQIIKVTEKGKYLDLIKKGDMFAWGLNYTGGMVLNKRDNFLYVTQPLKGTVMKVDPNDIRDYRFDPPIVQGLSMPTCVRFSHNGKEMYVCSMTTGTIWKVSNF